MQHIQGTDRDQVFMLSLGQFIAPDAFVKVFDAFGDAVGHSEYAEVVEANNKRITENPNYYRKRQQITEHMFGTLKRQMGFTHSLVRGKPKVLGEVSLMFTVYNLMRCGTILHVPELLKRLKNNGLLLIFDLKRRYSPLSGKSG